MKKITIGVVDDNKDFCDVVTEHLKKQSNMEISFVAHDGREAMEVLNRGNCPDVLVLDLIMPHLDGFGVLEGLNNLELSKYPRVIMTSAVGQDSMIQKAMHLGAQYYLVKPVNMSMLIKRINQLQDHEQEYFIHDTAQGHLRKSLVLKDSLAANDLEVDITNLIHEIGVPGTYQRLSVHSRCHYAGRRQYGSAQRCDEGAVSDGRSYERHHAESCGTRDPSCDRAGMESRQAGDLEQSVRLYHSKRQGEADEQ